VIGPSQEPAESVRCPWNFDEIEKLHQIGLCGVVSSQMRGATDKAVLDELDHRGVIHWRVRNLMASREGRDDHVRHTETELCGKPLQSRGVPWIGAGVIRSKRAFRR